MWKYLQDTFTPKPLELGTWNFERMFTSHHMSRVICHVSRVTCHMSHVICRCRCLQAHQTVNKCHFANAGQTLNKLVPPGQISNWLLPNSSTCFLLSCGMFLQKIHCSCLWCAGLKQDFRHNNQPDNHCGQILPTLMLENIGPHSSGAQAALAILLSVFAGPLQAIVKHCSYKYINLLFLAFSEGFSLDRDCFTVLCCNSKDFLFAYGSICDSLWQLVTACTQLYGHSRQGGLGVC